MKKKFLSMFLVFALVVMSICACFAGSGEQGFVDALTDPTHGINSDTMWGSITPVTGIIVTCFLFAFVCFCFCIVYLISWVN